MCVVGNFNVRTNDASKVLLLFLLINLYTLQCILSYKNSNSIVI